MQRRTAQLEAEVGKGWRAPAFGAEKEQAQADQCQMHGDRHDQQNQHRRTGQRLKGDAVDHGPERHDEQQGDHHLQPKRQISWRHGKQPGGSEQRQADVENNQRRQFGKSFFAQ